MGNTKSKQTRQTVPLKGPGIRQEDVLSNSNVSHQQHVHLNSNSTSGSRCSSARISESNNDHRHRHSCKLQVHRHPPRVGYFGADLYSADYNDEYKQRYLSNYHKYFLVLGYVNKYSRRKHSVDLPFDIEYLITCFYRSVDRWSIRYLDKALLRHSKNKLSSIHPTKYGVSIGRHIVEDNECYTWTVMMLDYKQNGIKNKQRMKTLIGIIEYEKEEIGSLTKSVTCIDSDKLEHLDEKVEDNKYGMLTQDKLLKTHHYLLDCTNGKLSPGDRRYTNGVIMAGDIMQIKLDLSDKREKSTLSFNINNKNYGVAFMGIEKTRYVLVAMIGNGTEIMII